MEGRGAFAGEMIRPGLRWICGLAAAGLSSRTSQEERGTAGVR